MGEVFRARDTKLERHVAIKVLPPAMAKDPDRLARFEREAKVLASLNHPNIAQIYGLEGNALVMELIEGSTLACPQPLETALGYARQIAEALEAAHEKGITHRDLKPANVMITPAGVVKVLDFGLAAVPVGDDYDPHNSPTMIAATQAGVIMGTAAYMSPEQAAGKPVDRRSDIWSFGVVLWEVLTGKKLFSGETISHTMAHVLTAPIDISTLPPSVPTPIAELLKRCLDRNLKTRLQVIGEARIAIDRYLANPEQAVISATPPTVSRAGWTWKAALGVAVAAAVSLAAIHFREAPPEPPQITKVSLLVPERATLVNAPVISPDGRRVVFKASLDGQVNYWLRDLDGLNARILSRSNDNASAYWSPDSRWIAFAEAGKLKKMDVNGGPAITICDMGASLTGAWSSSGTIVFSQGGQGLFRVSSAGGTPVLLSLPDSKAGETVFSAPLFLPDGQHFVYLSRNVDETKSRIYVDSVDARPGVSTRREVLATDSNAVYAPPPARASGDAGYLLFVRDHTLMAQRFDAEKATTAGDAMTVAEDVDVSLSTGKGFFSVSRNGSLVYASGALAGNDRQLTWFDRAGKATGVVGPPADINWARLSPDGSMVASDPLNGNRDIWLRDLARGSATRLTFAKSGASKRYPVWSPDGRRIVYYSIPERNPMARASDGSSAEEQLVQGSREQTVDDWSPDGRWLVTEASDEKAGSDLWLFPAEPDASGSRKGVPYVNSEFLETSARVSRNSQWLAYTSDESKRNEVYVQTFPEHGGKWQISTSGGDYAQWSRDGRELYFIGADRKLMAVEITGAGTGFKAGVPKPLFEVAAQRDFDVSKEGRFLIQVPVDQTKKSVALTLVTNWQAGLKK